MNGPYRVPATPSNRPRQWSFEELVRCGGYAGHTLFADRWTEGGLAFPWVTPAGLPDMRLTFLDDVRLEVLGDPDAHSGRRRPATLLELLWFGLLHPGVIGDDVRRLYAGGSVAWRHWEIDGSWTRHMPFLSDCTGRARLAELDGRCQPRRVACEPVAFLYAIQ